MKFPLFQNESASEEQMASGENELDSQSIVENMRAAARHAEIAVKKAEATAKKAEAAAARAEGLVKQVQSMLDEVGKRIEEARSLSLPAAAVQPDELKTGIMWEEKQDQEKFGVDLGIPRVSPYILVHPENAELSET